MDLNILKNVSSIIPRPTPASDDANHNVLRLTHLPCIGRIHYVNDKNGQTQMSVVVLYWAYGTFTSLYIILLPQYHDGRISVSVIISFMFVSIMCLLSLFKASFTNPGRVPRISAEDPSVDTSTWTWCRTCDRKRPARAHHCRRCRQCVMRMDHHCPWINNCVGEENHYSFFHLLFYAGLLGAYSLTLTFFHFWVWPKCTSCDKEVFYIKHSIWFVYFLVLLGLNMAVLMFIQLGHQHFNLILNKTTLENMQTPPSQANATFRRTYIAYLDLCGRGNMLWWFWPWRRRYPAFQAHTLSPV